MPGRARPRRADHPGQAGQAARRTRSSPSWPGAAWPRPRPAELVARDDRAGRGGPDPGRAEAQRGGRGRAWTRSTTCCPWSPPQVPAGRIAFTPRLVRGLSYYTGPIWEVVAAGRGRVDRRRRPLRPPDRAARRARTCPRPAARSASSGSCCCCRTAARARPRPARRGRHGHGRASSPRRRFGFAAAARAAGLRASVYLGSSGKLGRQLKWASDQGARWCLIYGGAEDEAGTVTVRDMRSGEQTAVRIGDLGGYLSARAAAGCAGPPMTTSNFIDHDTWFAQLPGVVVTAGALIRTAGRCSGQAQLPGPLDAAGRSASRTAAAGAPGVAAGLPCRPLAIDWRSLGAAAAGLAFGWPRAGRARAATRRHATGAEVSCLTARPAVRSTLRHRWRRARRRAGARPPRPRPRP